MISAATLSMSRMVAGYIDQTSEEMVVAYGQARENWLRNRSAARAAQIRDLLAYSVAAAGARTAARSIRCCMICKRARALNRARSAAPMRGCAGGVALTTLGAGEILRPFARRNLVRIAPAKAMDAESATPSTSSAAARWHTCEERRIRQWR